MLKQMIPFGAFSLALLWVGACERYTYNAKVCAIPGNPSKVSRVLDIRSHAQPNGVPPQSEIDRLTSIYGKAPAQLPDGTQRFERAFEAMPSDISSRGGIYVAYESDLGVARLYAEQFKGDYRLADRFERQQRACVLAGECLAVLTEQQFNSKPAAAQFAAFARTEFVNDLHDLLLAARFELWSHARAEQMSTSPDGIQTQSRTSALVRLAQFLVERGYVTNSDAGDFIMNGLQSFEESNALNETQSVRIVRGLVLRGAGTEATELADAFVELVASINSEGSSRFDGVLDRLATAPSIGAMLERLKISPTTGDSGREKLEQLRTGLAPLLALGPNFLDYDTFAIELNLPGEVLMANVSPSPSSVGTTVLNWKTSEPIDATDATTLPRTAFAIYAQPAIEKQSSVLGGVKLKGQALVNYCVAYAQLTQNEREQWNGTMSAVAFARIAESRPLTNDDDSQPSPNLTRLRDLLGQVK